MAASDYPVKEMLVQEAKHGGKSKVFGVINLDLSAKIQLTRRITVRKLISHSKIQVTMPLNQNIKQKRQKGLININS